MGESDNRYTLENSKYQFDAHNLMVRRVQDINLPILFPFIDEGTESLSYEPIFLKPPSTKYDKWYSIYTTQVVEPIYFNTKGIIERKDTKLYKNTVTQRYRLMTTKFFEHIVAKNVFIGYNNIKREKHIVGRNYIKAKRSVFGENNK